MYFVTHYFILMVVNVVHSRIAANTLSSGQKLARLRAAMRNYTQVSDVKLDGYYIPQEDAHQSEYVADCDKRIEYMTGVDLSGTIGLAIVTETQAVLITHWQLPQLAPDDNWIHIHNGFYSKSQSSGVKRVATTHNLIDEVWGVERPVRIFNEILPFPIQFSGKSWQDKITQVRVEMEKFQADLLVVSMLDEVAWLFNLRGSDLPFSPLFYSYAFVLRKKIRLFVGDTVNTGRLLIHLRDSAAEMQVGIYPYSAVSFYLSMFTKTQAKTRKIWLSGTTSQALIQLVPEDLRINQPSPIPMMKSVKNPTEIAGMKTAEVKDSLAYCEFLYWMEQEVGKGLDELKAVAKSEELRRGLPDYLGLSFPTVSAANGHAAIGHYFATEETNAQITRDSLYLVDAGSQFWDGTTDIARTVHFGSPTQHQRECFTRVLKGHIAAANLIFPEGTKADLLDSISRFSLWAAGLDFGHPLGHGIGHSLNVHEDPPIFGPSEQGGMRGGMTMAIEPGYYEDGHFGIRVESNYVVVEVQMKNQTGGKKFLTLEPLTLVPIQRKMIVASLLSRSEIDWINRYHQLCKTTLMPKLRGKPNVARWLTDATRKI